MRPTPLEVYPHHRTMLDRLLGDLEMEEIREVLDAGSGRTSLYFLTTSFPSARVTALVYPTDERKLGSIREHVPEGKYEVVRSDIRQFHPPGSFDLVLAHLLLGEAAAFGGSTFPEVLRSLFSFRSCHLAIVDILDDPAVDFRALLKAVPGQGELVKVEYVDKYIGFLVRAHSPAGS